MTRQQKWLTDDEQRAWRAYRRMHLLLDRQIAQDLKRDSGLSEADYDVLSHLSEANAEAALRVTDLAAHLRWTSSRLSHHLDRMRRRGLIDRQECADDARGAVIALTAEGWSAIEQAAPDHVQSVRRHFIDLLDPDELRSFTALAEKVLGHLR